MLYNGHNRTLFFSFMSSDEFWYTLLAISRMRSICMGEQPVARRLNYLQKFKVDSEFGRSLLKPLALRGRCRIGQRPLARGIAEQLHRLFTDGRRVKSLACEVR